MYKFNYIIAFIFLFSCNQKETRVIKLNIDNKEESYLQIINKDKKSAVFNIEINGMGIYSMNKMIEFIKKQYTGLNNAEKVWRFVSDYSQHITRVTTNSWHKNPLILMNSSGGSFCGYRSSIMVNLLKYMGENARSWALNGHIISEVFVNGKWQVYDPDLGVVYFNKNDEICSYDELCKNPDLITTPVKIISISNKCDSLTATSKRNAGFYSTQKDNKLFNTDYPDNLKNKTILFELPPESKLSFPLNAGYNDKMFALACLEIPPKWNGIIHIPLILYDVDGSAKVFFSNQQITKGRDQIRKLTYFNTKFEYKIKIANNIEGIKIYYYINPLIYFLDTENNIVIMGKNIKNLKLYACPYNKDDKPQWKNPCDNEAANEWYKYILKCQNFKKYKVDSYKTFVCKLIHLYECKALKNLNSDSSRFFQIYDSLASHNIYHY